MKKKKDDFSYCFKKAVGLKIISQNENLVEVKSNFQISNSCLILFTNSAVCS